MMSAAMTFISDDERRSVLRWNVDTPIKVFSNDKIAVLGQVANLSQGGMMMVGDVDLAAGTSHTLWLDIPHPDGSSKFVQVQVVVVWSGYSESERRYSAGLHFRACTNSLLAAVAHLVTAGPAQQTTA